MRRLKDTTCQLLTQLVWVFRFDGWGLPFGSRLDHPLVGVAVTHAPTAGASVAG